MIDLSYLTGEEHDVIMEVLNRDDELKKSEVERVKHLHDPEESRLKYFTGEWFYEMKSQRHQDTIHGSDLIRASIDQQKPISVEFLSQSWKERNIKSVTNKPPKSESSDSPIERGSSQAQPNQLNSSIRSHSRLRHNPFNALPMDVDLDFTSDVSEPEDKESSVRADIPLSFEMSTFAETDTKTKVYAPQETPLYQQPVPRKRTKLYNLQNPVAESTSSVSTDSMSTGSCTQSPKSTMSVSASSESRSASSIPSMSINSGIRSPPAKGIPKYSFSGSSSDFKSNLPQPLKRINTIPPNISSEQFLSENKIDKSSDGLIEPLMTSPVKSTLPTSRLPLSVNHLMQTEQEKPTVQPRLSLKSRNEHNLFEDDGGLNSSTSAKTKDQNILNKTTKELKAIPRIRASSPFEALLDKPLNESPIKKLEDSGYLKENKTKTKPAEHPQTSTAQCDYKANNKENSSKKPDVSLACENDLSPLTSNKKTTEHAVIKVLDSKQPLKVDSQYSKSPEKGESISKVLEWFSKSTDSSNFLDYEDNVYDSAIETNVEDIDFEEEIYSKPKPENNVYVIIPRQNDGMTVTDSYLNDTELETDISGNEHEPFTQSPNIEDLPNQWMRVEESHDVKFCSIESDHPQNASLKEEVPERVTKKENTANADKAEGIPSKLDMQKLNKKMSHEDNRPPNMDNLKSFWEKGKTETPRMLVSQNNVNPEREKMLKQSSVEIQKTDNLEEPAKVSGSFDLSNIDIKKQTIMKHDKVEDIQALQSRTNVIKAIPPQNYISDTDVSNISHCKSSLFPINNESVEENTSVKNIKGPEKLMESAKTKEKELHIKSSLKSDMSDSISFSKQTKQQPDNRTERIKDLKSFWEKDKYQPQIYVKPAPLNVTKSSPKSFSNLSKRFTKSEFNLNSIGTELEEDGERREESMNRSQFKSLLEFWAGSSNKNTPDFKSKVQRPSSQVQPSKDNSYKQFMRQSSDDLNLYRSQNFNQNHLDKVHLKGVESDGSESTKSLKTARPDSGINSSSYKSEETDLRNSSTFMPLQKCSDSNDLVSPNSPGTENNESHQRTRSSMKGVERDLSLRRARSMFAINLSNEDEASDLQKVPGLSFPLGGNTKESNTSSSRKTSETKSQLKKSLNFCEDSAPQPLVRSFVPPDYQNYQGMTENTEKCVPSQNTDKRTSEFVCTPFTSSLETGSSMRCSSGKVSTPVGSPDLGTWRGSLGPQLGACNTEDLDYKSAIQESSWCNSPDLENLVQVTLQRAFLKTAYHKSLEDITSISRQPRINQPDESWPERYDASDTPSPPASFLDRERMKKLSKSVPLFLDQEDDESDLTSEYSSQSGLSWRNSISHANLSSNSGMASLSSVSGSVTSVSSGDFQSIDVKGTIQFSLNYVQKLREFHIFVVQCKNLAAVDAKRNRSDPYVKSYLMPDSPSLGKRKTSVKRKTLNPMYNEILRYRVPMENLKTQTLNLSVWHNDTFGRNSFLGETQVDLSTWDFKTTKVTNLPLKPRARSSIQPTGEMRLAIRFLPQISHHIPTKDLSSGEVHIWVKDCKNLPVVRGTTVDPYVKCLVLPDTSKKSRQKTRVLKRTLNPVFNHTMVYDGFRAEDLMEACVELSVWDRDRLGDHLIGGIRLGPGKGQSYGVKVDWMDSNADEVDLWERVMDSPNNWVEDVLPLRMLATSKHLSK